MAYNQRFEYMAGPFSQGHSEASAWCDGYNTAKGIKWNHPDAAAAKRMGDLYHGYKKGFPYRDDGFFAVKTVILTDAEKKEIDNKALKKKAKEAEEKALVAFEEAKRLQELLLKEGL